MNTQESKNVNVKILISKYNLEGFATEFNVTITASTGSDVSIDQAIATPNVGMVLHNRD